jgi:hypothetical protein
MSQCPLACQDVPRCSVRAVLRARSPPAVAEFPSDEPAAPLTGTVGTRF